jgi:hypothetical protein
MPVFPLIPKTFLEVYQGHKEILRPPNISVQTNIIVMSEYAGTQGHSKGSGNRNKLFFLRVLPQILL